MIFDFACAALLYSGFCRLVRMDLETRMEIRLAIYSLTVAALAAIYARAFLDYKPEWPSTGLAVTILFVQVVTARLWRRGVPDPYQYGSED